MQLGLSALRLPSSLAELGSSPLFSAAGAAGAPDAAEVAAVLQQARRRPVSELDWALLFQAVSSGQLQGSQAEKLVAVLTWAADSAREQLEAATAAGERPSGGGAATAAAAAAADVGNPRLRQALQNTLKLALIFLCAMARGEGTADGDAQHPAPGGSKRGGKKHKGPAGGCEAAAEALAQLRVRRDALLAAGSIEDALHDNRALLPVSDLRAAGRLVRGAAMHCLAHPLPPGAAGGDRTAKDLAEACFQGSAGILARTFVGAGEGQAQAAAAQTLQDLLGVVAEPKQQAQVLAGAARLVGSVMQQSRRAGSALVAGLIGRIQQAAAAASKSGRDASGATLAAQQQDACLLFAVQLAGTGCSGSSALPAALLLRLPQLLPLARSPSSSTRRLMLDLCSALLPTVQQLPFNPAAAVPQPVAAQAHAGAEPAAPGAEVPAADAAPFTAAAHPGQAYRAALLAAVGSRLEDKDATLRAKALGCLEKHSGLVAAHMSAAADASGHQHGAEAGGSGSNGTLLKSLFGRLCDKSPSVRKKAVSLLAALLQPAACLSRSAAAELVGAVLPLAAQLLGVRPDSALHLGEDTLKVLSQAVLRMAAASSSAAGVPHLLQLAAGASEPAAQAQLQAAVLDLLLPPSAGRPSADLLLRNLTAAAQQCSEPQLQQLRQAVQQAVASGSGGAMAAAVRSAVRTCYGQLHALCSKSSGSRQVAESGSGEPADAGLSAHAGAAPADARSETLLSGATALLVLGPLSSQPQRDALASLAEARLLPAGLQHIAQAGLGHNGPAAARLLACTGLAWQQLAPACLPADGSNSQPSEEPSAAGSAALALAHATLPALQALLLDPGCSASLRQAAFQALFALSAAAQVPLRLLRSLVAATAAQPRQQGAAEAELLGLHLPLSGEGELQLGIPDGCPLPNSGGDATAASACQSAEDSARATAAHQASSQQQHVQQSALVGLLDLLGGLASTYEQQKAAFLQQLVAGAAQRERQQAQQQQAEGQTSHFGRPLRPASEWWMGTGQAAGGAAEQARSSQAAAQEGGAVAASAAAAADAAAADDYMRAEHLAAEHEAAAQRYLESLLEAADTAPACYLPLLERLAGGAGGLEQAPEGDQEDCGAVGAAALPSVVRASALRALGRLALLSEPLSQRAVALAEAAVGGSSGSSWAATVVQAAAVALLADAIEAFPNRYSDRLLLIGGLMAPAGQAAGGPAVLVEEQVSGPAESSGAGGVEAAREPAAGSEQQQDIGAQQAQQAQQVQQPADGIHHAAHQTLSPEQQEQLSRASAAAYCRLLLRNKLKLQGMLGPLGCALAAASPPVVALVQHALRQMLGAAAPKERARLCMALFHQTPPGCRVALAQALVDPAHGLLPAAELRGDVLVSQALQALLAAAQASGSSAGRVLGGEQQDCGSLAAAATLLRAMQPSAKVLAALHTQLQGGGGGTGGSMLDKLPAAARQALLAFVGSHMPAAAGREEGNTAADGGAAEGSAAGGKRKRATGASKGASTAVQQQLLVLLGCNGGGGRGAAWRPPRPASTATATAGVSTVAAVVSTAAGASTAAPATSVRSGGGQPSSSSLREPASSARATRSRAGRRSVRSRVLEEESSDSEASS